METVVKKAVNPDTRQEYEIELPAPEVVQKAILELDYPSDGIRLKEASDILAEKFQLSDKQRNAENRQGDKVFYHDVVYPQFGYLLKKGKLDQPKGSKTPYVLAANTPLSLSVEPGLNTDLGLIPEELIEENYQQIRGQLAEELLRQIKDNTPAFFEELVIDLLVKMGYGGSREDAGKAVGGSGDGGIDGIIKADPLGLNVVYIQAKRWEGKVGTPPVRDFVGALDGEGVQDGIFITTSDFNPAAKAFAEKSSKRVILINGSQLAQYMIDHNVGVSTTKTYEIKRVDSDYFAADSENS